MVGGQPFKVSFAISKIFHFSIFCGCSMSQLRSAFFSDRLEHVFSTACRVCIMRGLARGEVVHMMEFVVFSVGVGRSRGKNTKRIPTFYARGRHVLVIAPRLV